MSSSHSDMIRLGNAYYRRVDVFQVFIKKKAFESDGVKQSVWLLHAIVMDNFSQRAYTEEIETFQSFDEANAAMDAIFK
jgi:hypothetical protein